MENFFKSALDDPDLQLKLREDGNIFFLHLLGCDTNGHVHKPHSAHYRDNINTVDEGVRRTVRVLEEYFRGDGRTAFLVTADHGMTDWGSHGTGMDQETVTPLAAWGAGVARLAADSSNLGPRPVTADPWPWPRLEVAQADLAPLMASLVGVPIPVHSVGRLPVSALQLHPRHQVEAVLAQAEQLLAQFSALQTRHQQVGILYLFYSVLHSSVLLCTVMLYCRSASRQSSTARSPG